MQALDEAASESDAPPEYEEDEIEDGEDLVTRTFRRLFPDSFEGVIPIRNHKVHQASHLVFSSRLPLYHIKY